MKRAERHEVVETPQSLGRYRIRGLLGEGGMGRLYVAEQAGIAGFAKTVAVKRILPHLADSEHFRSLFLHEARVAARLEHPNIVATHELGETDGAYFIAMEYLPGEDLSAILARCQDVGPMPLEFAVYIAQQCANGLHYAHQLRDSIGRPSGLVHRDVNPSNIFVTYHGMVKLLDFGVVKASTGFAGTAPGVFKGKYAYCAPEQLAGEGVDPRTDVFSLGIVLWECLTGNALFANPSDAATIDAVRAQTIVPPSLLRPEVPLGLNHITMRALFRDRARRYQSAAEMSEALEQFLSEDHRRPATKSVGQWLESLFGSERAALKRSIAQGNDVEQALAQLAPGGGDPDAAPRRASTTSERNPTLVRLRPAWSTSFDRATPGRGQAVEPPVSVSTTTELAPAPPGMRLPAAPLEPLRPRPRRRWRGAVVAVAAVVVAASGLLLVTGLRRPEPAQVALGALQIDSRPTGAHVFLEGDPTGMSTPATLRQLPTSRPIEIRLVKAGYAPEVRRILVTAGGTSAQSFVLREALGRVRLEGVPPQASVYLDDTLTDARVPFTASVGRHQLRIEEASDVIFSNTVEVKPGDQTLRIRAERSGR